MLKKLLALSLAAGLAVPAAAQTIRSYITCPDRSELFAQQKHAAEFSTQRQENRNYIIIDPRQSYQRIDGFGYALTGGSAEHLMKMSPEARKSLLKELFDPQQGIGISCIRLTLGASDLNSFVFSYDDMPAGKEDFELKQFSLGTRPPRRGSGHAGDPGHQPRHPDTFLALVGAGMDENQCRRARRAASQGVLRSLCRLFRTLCGSDARSRDRHRRRYRAERTPQLAQHPQYVLVCL